MSTLAEIEMAAASLNLEEQQVLVTRLAAKVRMQVTLPANQPRIPGLHRGMVWMSDDFNDPLPEEFWLGKDLESGIKHSSES